MTENITERTIVRDLVVKYPAMRIVLEKLGVDYCCGGQHTLREAALEKGVELKKILDGLNTALADPGLLNAEQKDWTKASLSELTNHIVNRHHTFMKQQMPRLESMLAKVRRAHDAAHGAMLGKLCEVFAAFKAEIDQHLLEEERVIVPAVRQLESEKEGRTNSRLVLEAPINQMQVEHESAGHALARMREMTSGYRLPADACPTFAALYEGLAAVEADLHEHVHLENNILIPRTLALAGNAGEACPGCPR